jgi:hypothetical protein
MGAVAIFKPPARLLGAPPRFAPMLHLFGFIHHQPWVVSI